MTTLKPVLRDITAAIIERSRPQRAAYLEQMQAAKRSQPSRSDLPCSNLAHVVAASATDKEALTALRWPNIGIVTAYNDMLSAHQPFESYPALIRQFAREVGATAQVAGGVPAMCDGVTQGRAGMELSLFSRDVIALATAVALSHDSFDAALLLGVCDKIVPGLFMGAARFGHIPIAFVPAGPMPSGLSNAEKARVRQRFTEGLATRAELLAAESAAYHSAGTCTFYGTANSNQMLMEMMGLHIPGAAFVHPSLPLRAALTRAATHTVAARAALGPNYLPFAAVVDERSFVNALAGLMATGGSTNHALHLIAMAAAVGITLELDDFARVSAVTPLLARVYPNGSADVNQFHAAGGLAFVTAELIAAGLLHADAMTITGQPLSAYARDPILATQAGQKQTLEWRDAVTESLDEKILRPISRPFSADGGLRVLDGNIGRAVVKVSAVSEHRHLVRAPARVFEDQAALDRAFKAGELDGHDFVAVVRYQGPRANGMPELHKLTPPLAVLQDRGQQVALVTDGRMSGASGKVPAAIHVTPEAIAGGTIARIRDGDMIVLDARNGRLEVECSAEELARRPVAPPTIATHGVGRELFRLFREHVSTADRGASVVN
jgi:phosphogluconate dehydratase